MAEAKSAKKCRLRDKIFGFKQSKKRHAALKTTLDKNFDFERFLFVNAAAFAKEY